MKCMLVLALLVSFGAQASSFKYDCFSYYWNDQEDESHKMELVVYKKSAKGTFHAQNLSLQVGGALNENYRSRGDITYVKYGTELVTEKSLMTGGRRLRDGNWGGFVRVEGRAEGEFYQYKFICKLK